MTYAHWEAVQALKRASVLLLHGDAHSAKLIIDHAIAEDKRNAPEADSIAPVGLGMQEESWEEMWRNYKSQPESAAEPTEQEVERRAFLISPEFVANRVEILRARDLEIPEFHAMQLQLADMLESLSSRLAAEKKECSKIAIEAVMCAARLAAERKDAERLRAQIKEHNDGLELDCEARQNTPGSHSDLCKAYISRGRACVDCPRDYHIAAIAESTK